MQYIRFFSYLILFTLIFGSCAQNPVTGKKEFMLMTEEQEISLGAEADPDIVKQYGVYNHPVLQKFVEDNGRRMAALSHRPGLNYQFRILDSPVVNAFALPGGYVYFTRGILAHFNNEAEFAGVLGHELGHITARHSAKQYSKQVITELLILGGMMVSEEFRRFSDVAQQGAGLLFLKFSRDNETESDELGVSYSTKAGYDAREMAGFFKTLEKLGAESGSIPTFLSTHPDPGDRFTKVGKLADQARLESGNQDLKVNRNDYLSIINGVVYGDDPKQGFVDDGVFYHPVMRFRFDIPKGWNVQNMPSQVQLAPANGKAMLAMSMAEGKSLEAARDKAVADNKLTVIQSSETTVHGLRALRVLSEIPAESSQSTSLKVLTYFIALDESIFKFHGLSSLTDFSSFESEMAASMTSFMRLTDPSKLNRQPMTIRIVEARESASLQKVLEKYQMPEKRWKELVLLNGLELSDMVEKGTSVKILGGQFN